MQSNPAGAGRPVHVVHVITQLELGGAQQNTLFTVGHLDRARFQPWLLAGPGGPLDDAARAIPDLRFATVPDLVRPVDPRADRRALRQLQALLAQVPQPCIVHTHSSKAGILGRLAARRARVRATVHSVHGFAFHDGQALAQRLVYQALERLAAPLADAYVCVSRADLTRGLALGLFGDAPVALIRSGIEFEPFAFNPTMRARVRRQLGLADGVPVVGTVANFKPQKAPLDFVEVAARVHLARPDVRFLYLGDGGLRPQVEQALRARGLEASVLLLGWQADIGAHLSAMDLFLLTSHHEGLPRSLVQALVSGCPAVATRTGGTEELLPAERTAAAGDVERLAALVLQTLAQTRPRRAALALSPVLAAFDAHRMVRDQERLYLSLLDRRA